MNPNEPITPQIVEERFVEAEQIVRDELTRLAVLTVLKVSAIVIMGGIAVRAINKSRRASS